MKIKRIILSLLILLILILSLFEISNLDVYFQNLFFKDGHWLINADKNKIIKAIFYDGIKRFTIIIGIIIFISLILSFKVKKLKPYKNRLILSFTSFILIPIIVAGLKQFTNTYCPYQLNIYDGEYPYVKLLEKYPKDFIQEEEGRCFPAGHSTSGFALISLLFLFKKNKKHILTIATLLGIIAGTYQTLRGAHFLSHTLFSLISSYIILFTIYSIYLNILRVKKNVRNK